MVCQRLKGIRKAHSFEDGISKVFSFYVGGDEACSAAKEAGTAVRARNSTSVE
jgi:hypothetical protein